LDLTEAELRKAAQDFDSGVNQDGGGDNGQATDPVKPAEDNPQDADSPDDKASEADGGSQDGKDGDEGDGQAQKDDRKAKDDSQDSKKSKFAKEIERQGKTWKEINAEKEALKAEREAIQRERQEWEKQRKASDTTDPENFRDSRGFTAKQYEEEAKRFEDAGEDTHAKVARRMAEEARDAARKAHSESERAKFQKAFEDNYHKLSEKNAWLKDQNDEKYKRTVDLLNRYPVLQQTPDGLVHAVELIELQDKAASASKLGEEIASLKGELEKLRKKTSIGGGKPTSQKGAEVPFEKLSLKEQEAQLNRLAREFDAANG
jgi:hypothetical protein